MPSTYTSIHFHVVFAVKGREPVIDTSWRSRLHLYLGGAAKGQGTTPLEVNGFDDHVHLLLGLRSTQAIAPIVREIKKSSNGWVQEEMGLKGFAWQEGYAALSESTMRIQQLRHYIQNQEEHHRHVSSRDELLELLREAGIKPDMRFFE